ncbi:hypothetical protein B0H13DRAFT_2579087 [Mycena leptocephala]|nr:hypothetical protein B0H13DRAFT_2579087 [Mycena leptocephala]
MALTSLSRWPSPPRSWICLSAPRSRIIHRGSCAEPQTSSSFPRAPVASGLANPCLIPARWWADDARAEPLRVLCALAFCVRAEAAFGRRIHVSLPPHPPSSPSPGSYDRYLPVLAHLVRLSTGWMGTGTGTAGPDLMRKEKRAPGNGNSDEDGLGARPWRRSAVSLRFGAAAHAVEAVTYCPPALIPPSFVFALALALVPAFAHTLALPLSLVPVMPASTWRGMGRADLKLRWYTYALAHSQRWRSASAGAGAGVARAHPSPHRPPPHPPPRVRPAQYAYVLRLGRGHAEGEREPSARTLRGSGYTFVFGCALARRGGGDGDG